MNWMLSQNKIARIMAEMLEVQSCTSCVFIAIANEYREFFENASKARIIKNFSESSALLGCPRLPRQPLR